MRAIRMRAGVATLGLATTGLLGAGLPATAASASINICGTVLQTATLYAQPGVDPIGTAYQGDKFLTQNVQSGYRHGWNQHYDPGTGKVITTYSWIIQNDVGQPFGTCY